ncbi:hypothetical protein T03_15773 [Trichinella britovi]|uniref:Uncharacterized protein n=1 Tax=Trichinella britovi TaxID=45882 RepID=A0A0V0YRE3_TRIBR|nr:hypothetical protein T06_6937 [Trichinella sp. T6]KRX51033.1 hypothetical protein T09_11024 [Trichinella sp. T9]KRY02753.1 hypothetical protein T03_15773 [Trichinella britovi]
MDWAVAGFTNYSVTFTVKWKKFEYDIALGEITSRHD